MEKSISDFKREDRYLVIKRGDIEKYLPDDKKKLLDFIAGNIRDGRALDGKESLQCVVVEHDWPEYEMTCNCIEARMIIEDLRKQREYIIHALRIIADDETDWPRKYAQDVLTEVEGR